MYENLRKRIISFVVLIFTRLAVGLLNIIMIFFMFKFRNTVLSYNSCFLLVYAPICFVRVSCFIYVICSYFSIYWCPTRYSYQMMFVSFNKFCFVLLKNVAVQHDFHVKCDVHVVKQ